MNIPQKSEFVTVDEDLDQQCAWEQFGGRSLDAAYALIKGDPLNRMEDLMHMGPKAFCFYVQAAIRYLREAESRNDQEMVSGFVSVCESWIDGRIESVEGTCLADLQLAMEYLLNRGDSFTHEYREIPSKLRELIDKTIHSSAD
ncbi:MAG: hypothetical protein ACO34E_15915 [Limisphaerales bacterium]